MQDLSWILNGSNLKQDVGRDFAIRILASGPEQSMKSIIDGQSITKSFEIIDYHRLYYQYHSIIDGNRSINIIDCYQYAISIDYLFSQTFQLSISSSTNKVTLFDIIAFYLSKN